MMILNSSSIYGAHGRHANDLGTPHGMTALPARKTAVTQGRSLSPSQPALEESFAHTICIDQHVL